MKGYLMLLDDRIEPIEVVSFVEAAVWRYVVPSILGLGCYWWENGEYLADTEDFNPMIRIL